MRVRTALVSSLAATAAPALALLTSEPKALAGFAFDYVIVGGGTAGLVLANRLSENSSVTVAVIEAGGTGDDVMQRILAPGLAFSDGLSAVGQPTDWGYATTPQKAVNGRSLAWPRVKVLGGCSAGNAMYVIRPGQLEHDSIAELNSGSRNLSWSAMLDYYKKTENFNAPTADYAVKAGGIPVNASAHGRGGPIDTSYPAYVYHQASLFNPTLNALGHPTVDPNDGSDASRGTFVSPVFVKPSTSARSYTRNGYLDPVINRKNLAVLVGQQVTTILFETGKAAPRAVGVTIASSPTSPSYAIAAAQEVILTAGVIGTPQLLQLSGIGPKSVLQSAGVQPLVDLPGVGENLQDHILVPLVLNTTATSGDRILYDSAFKASQLALWTQGSYSASLISAPNTGISYLNLTSLFGADGAARFRNSSLDARLATAAPTGSTSQAGFSVQYDVVANRLMPSGVGSIEILQGNTGSWRNLNSSMVLQASIQHPLSRGYVRINGSSPFARPTIDPATLAHPADMNLLIAGLKYARRIAATAPLSSILTGEVAPGAAVQSDDDLRTYIRQQAATQYHPCCSAPMLPQTLGGVVDSEYRVYGVTNLRVVDGSVLPMAVSAHLAALTMALAERAADLILHPPVSAADNSSSPSVPNSTTAASSASRLAPALPMLLIAVALLSH